MHASARARNPTFQLVLKVIAFVLMATAGGGLLATGAVTESAQVLTGGVAGTTTVTACHHTSRSTMCSGSFRADTGFTIPGISIYSGVPKVGSALRGVVGGSRSPEFYPAGNAGPLAPLALFLLDVLVLVTAVVAWPLRWLIHLRRPDVWPVAAPRRYWRGPPLIRGLRLLALGLGTVLLVAIFVGLAGLAAA